MARIPGEDRGAEILQTASELLARNGFHGVSMDELGVATGVSGPALCRYVACKGAIL